MSLDVENWIVRGNGLNCFSTDLEQARYLMAWQDGDIRFVAENLERIFTVIHRLPVLNALAFPEIPAVLAQSDDCPLSYIEDWSISDFLIKDVGENRVSPVALISEDGSFVPDSVAPLLSKLVSEFLGSEVGEKVGEMRSYLSQASQLAGRSPVKLSSLLDSYVKLRFIELSSLGSEQVNMVLGASTRPAVLRASLERRISALLNVWKFVFLGERRPVTLERLRSCSSVFHVNRMLLDIDTESTHNLISYLRCENT